MRKIKLTALTLGSLGFLTACGNSQISSEPQGLWESLVLFFANSIKALSFDSSIAVGIILFTLLVRLILTPLYNMQIKSGRQMQDIQPDLRELQKQYPGKDTESRMKLAEASQALYKEHGINPYASFIPLLIQLPVMLGLYQALIRVDFVKQGHFLWFDLAKPDPYFILPILAAALTFLSTWLSQKGAREVNIMMKAMNLILPAMILLFGLNFASGLALYWVISNAYQVAQILIFNNPFAIIAERQAKEMIAKEKAARKRRAYKKAKRRK